MELLVSAWRREPACVDALKIERASWISLRVRSRGQGQG